jgi:hypothetical protein
VLFLNGLPVVNILAPEDKNLAAIFAGQPDIPMAERFARAN